MSDPPEDDRITHAILSEDPDRRLRVERRTTLARYRPATKLRALGGLGVGCALVVFLLAYVRGGALAQTLDVDPLAASVAGSVVLAAGLKYVTIGGVGLAAVEYLRHSRPVTERRAERLLGIEAAVGVVGVVIGGSLTLVGLGLFVGLATGVPALTRLLASAVQPVPMPITYGLVAAWSAADGVCFLAASVLLESSGD